MYTKLDITNLIQLTGSGVYCFINDSSKKVYIGYGINILNSLQRILTQYKSNSLPSRTLQNEFLNLEYRNICLLDTNNKSTSFVLKVLATQWINKYKELGYEVLNNKLPVNYEIMSYIELDEIVVVLRTKNRKEVVLGRFKSNSDSEQFMSRISNEYLIEVLSR